VIVLVKIRSLSSAPVLLRYFTFTYGSITSYPLREKFDNLEFSRGVARSPITIRIYTY
jgi:hypothetical protein